MKKAGRQKFGLFYRKFNAELLFLKKQQKKAKKLLKLKHSVKQPIGVVRRLTVKGKVKILRGVPKEDLLAIFLLVFTF